MKKLLLSVVIFIFVQKVNLYAKYYGVVIGHLLPATQHTQCFEMNCIQNAMRTLLFTTLAVTSVILTIPEVHGTDNVEKITHCRDNGERSSENRLLFVTTLDGRLSALGVNGEMKWSVPTGPGTLLSSSIHSYELTNNGRMLRLIPSLSGGLYQFDGHTIESIPITADQLLTASFKFSSDVVTSGGKDVRSYGISMRTGQVLYECSIGGCQNRTDALDEGLPDLHDPLLDDVIVLRRQTQTVRAVDPRTGAERWNFSVGHHEMDIARSENCHLDTESETDPGYEIKMVVPEGLVCAISKNSPNKILWKYKFDYPIVSAWKSNGGQNLQTVDLFDSAQSLWDGNEGIPSMSRDTIPPSVYVGMFKKQVYIQESDAMRKSLQSPLIIDNKAVERYTKIPWKPYPAASSAWQLIQFDDEVISEKDEDSEENKGTALSVLYASEFANGNGFYLYPAIEEKHPFCDKDNTTSKAEIVEDDGKELKMEKFVDMTTIVRLKSLLFWWKEIFVIAVTSSFVINLFMNNRRLRPKRDVMVIERLVETPFTKFQEEETEEAQDLARHRSLSESNNQEAYTSRFHADFEMLQCLGKGGFGVVFEAKNKIDHCKYAIKRIVLPSKKESRDRVMREVRTLANCEHQNIVRYFQAWMETPPPGWQENEDRIWMAREALSTSIDIGTPTETSMPPTYGTSNPLSQSIPPKTGLTNPWIFKQNDGMNFSDEDFGAKSRDRIDDDSSFIQFANDSGTGADEGAVFTSEDRGMEDDSFIEFRHNGTMDEVCDPKQPILPTHFTSSGMFGGDGEQKRDRRKRPMSLDLTSQGGVILGQINTRMYLYIQMQLCQKQSLKEWLQMSGKQERQNQIIPIFDQIVRAVEYVHEKGLIHRDLKPSNIFFSLDGQIKIGDFGLVTDMADNACDENDPTRSPLVPKKKTHTQKVGTHLYMSPEQMAGKPYDYKVDIYSLGLILFELLVNFSTEMERIKTLEGVRAYKFPPDFPSNHTSEYALLQLMLSQDPCNRPTTFGIRARPPLEQTEINPQYHFVLPPRRQESRSSTGSSSGLSRESV
uniref:non-specific serine/threonine protein kinase n=1 Tax=Nyssomyia neivai TaxID=330878 RepID=A0A1L8DRY1_9DIPT